MGILLERSVLMQKNVGLVKFQKKTAHLKDPADDRHSQYSFPEHPPVSAAAKQLITAILRVLQSVVFPRSIMRKTHKFQHPLL